MAWTFFTGFAVPIVLAEIMSAAAACTYQNVSGAARTRMTPRLALPAEGLGRKLNPPFTRPSAPGKFYHRSHETASHIALIIVDNRECADTSMVAFLIVDRFRIVNTLLLVYRAKV